MACTCVRLATTIALVLTLGSAAEAQSPSPTFTLPGSLAAPEQPPVRATRRAAQPTTVTNADGDWKFSVYPLIAWVPANISVEVELPFDIGGGGGGGGGSDRPGISIVDGRFDGAFLAAFGATNGTWRFDFDGVYAAVGGDRVTPHLTVDVTVIYAHATVSRALAGGFFVTGGVRRFALDFDIDFLDFDTFSRKPGIWDPLVGIAYHKAGHTFEFHSHAEYGGFGVGADHDFGVGARVDWKPFDHFGFTAGYNFVAFKFKEEIGPFEFSAKQTIGGPVVGIGLYF